MAAASECRLGFLDNTLQATGEAPSEFLAGTWGSVQDGAKVITRVARLRNESEDMGDDSPKNKHKLEEQKHEEHEQKEHEKHENAERQHHHPVAEAEEALKETQE